VRDDADRKAVNSASCYSPEQIENNNRSKKKSYALPFSAGPFTVLWRFLHELHAAHGAAALAGYRVGRSAIPRPAGCPQSA